MSFDKQKSVTEQQNNKWCYVIGWCDAYGSDYQTVPFTNERKKALIECIRKRRYNFTYETHQTLSYCAPFYSDRVLCVLTKSQWDDVMANAYKDIPFGQRLIPMDIIDSAPKNGVLYEKRKFNKEGGEFNG